MWGLGRLAWPDWSDDRLRKEMTYRFVYGLTDEIQERLHLFAVPTNLEKARERAVNADIGVNKKTSSNQDCVVEFE